MCSKTDTDEDGAKKFIAAVKALNTRMGIPDKGVDFEKPVLLGYTGLTDVFLKKYIKDSRKLWEGGLSDIRYTTIGSVIGTHAGPGAIAAAFFVSEKRTCHAGKAFP